MTAGIVMTASALPLGLVGAYMSDQSYKECLRDAVPTSSGQSYDYDYEKDCKNSRETRNVVIGVLAIAMIGVGIPLIVYGAKRVPSTAEVTLTPWVSPIAAGATFRLSM
jgi:hypothetical protein